jgi:hypothetical protein
MPSPPLNTTEPRTAVVWVGFDSETAQFPVGDVRKYWYEHRLAELDAVRIPLEQHYERLLMGAARRLRTSLSQLDDQ